MSRKTKTITVTDRDNELTFLIEEMPATKTQRWLAKVLLLITGSGAEVPDIRTVKSKGEMGAFLIKALSGLDYDKAEPLLGELLRCCSRILSNGTREQLDPATVDGVIADVSTLFTLQLEAAKLHFDFFSNMLPSGWKERLMAKAESTFNT